jgi:hypothetical protein
MKAPDRHSNPTRWPYPTLPKPTVATPTVYPVDDQVEEGLLGPDGKPVNEGTRRKNPIGYARPEQAP